MSLEIKKLNWDQVNGNPYMKRLSPVMLTEQGLTETRQASTKADKGRSRPERGWIQVTYDKEYVAEKIIYEILNPLAITDYNTFQKLISGVWKRWNERQTQKN